MDGSVARRAIGIHRGPGLRPPRGPCEFLPGAALWGKILRVLYLHDNTVPKNQLWRNGRKPAEVIGCRHGEGAGPRSLRNFCMEGAWSPGPEKLEGGGMGGLECCCCCAIKQAARSSVTMSRVSDPLGATPGSPPRCSDHRTPVNRRPNPPGSPRDAHGDQLGNHRGVFMIIINSTKQSLRQTLQKYNRTPTSYVQSGVQMHQEGGGELSRLFREDKSKLGNFYLKNKRREN